MREIEDKQAEIERLKQLQLDSLKGQPATTLTAYSTFLEERLAENQLENRRILAKYQEMRNFAYSQLETLIRQQNKRKNNAVGNNNLQVYKQMLERERKHWSYEIEQKQKQIDNYQQILKSEQLTRAIQEEKQKEMQEEMEQRDECEAQVQEYVKTLLAKNKELQAQLASNLNRQ